MNRRKVTFEDLMGPVPKKTPTPEEEEETRKWVADLQHPKNYFDLDKLDHRQTFSLLPAEVKEIEGILKEQKITLPEELKEGIFWIAGFLKYRFNPKRLSIAKKKWDEEREYYQREEVKDGINLYYTMNRLPDWEAIESITFKVKPGFSYGGIPEKTLEVSYSEMIRFIVDAIRDKRQSWNKNESQELFFAEELEKLEKYTDNDEWYRAEVEANGVLDPKYRETENNSLKKYRRTKKSLSNYLALQNKKIIEGIYGYLTDRTEFKQAHKIKVIAGLFYFADVPDSDGKRKKNTDDIGAILEEVRIRIKQYVDSYNLEKKNPKAKKGMKG